MLALVYLAMAGSILTSLGDVVDGVVLSVVSVLIGAGQVVLSQRCRLILTGDSVVVVNPLRTRIVPLRQIIDVSPGAGGLAIETGALGTVRVFAVQTAAVVEWLRLPSRAEQISDELRLAASDAGAAVRPGPRHLATPN